jgi:protein disulfide-isomerase
MKKPASALALLAVAFAASASDAPYDETANAKAEVQQVLEAARTDHKQILLVFGANWCPDCRELDKALHGTSRALVEGRFDVVKIDVGNFDKNLDLAERYGNPIEKGIPAIVVLTADGKISYSTKGGELANARKMGETGIYDFLVRSVAKPAG